MRDFIPTPEELSADRRGTENPNAKLTPEVLEVIRATYRPHSREFGQRALARRFGVDRKTVENVLHGRTYA